MQDTTPKKRAQKHKQKYFIGIKVIIKNLYILLVDMFIKSIIITTQNSFYTVRKLSHIATMEKIHIQNPV